MNRKELKQWAKEKVNGKRWSILPALLIGGILTNLSIYTGKTANGIYQYYSLGWILFFIEVGVTYFMVKFITDKDYEFNDIFYFGKDFVKTFLVSLLKMIFVSLWTLLLIIPGILKSLSYSLVSMIMSDEKYKDLSGTEILKKSEAMMKGHRWDYVVLVLSFIGWHFLACFTFFILELWIAPYQKTATTKFLYDVKTKYEQENN